MILLRPADPDLPIVITNAVTVEVEEDPGWWFFEAATYLIESANVDIREVPE